MDELRLNQKLQVLRMVQVGITHQAIANQFSTSPDNLAHILHRWSDLEHLDTSEPQGRNLTLGDKIRVLHRMDIHKNQSLVGRICKIHRKTVKNILDSRSRIITEEAKEIPISVKRPLKAMYPLM